MLIRPYSNWTWYTYTTHIHKQDNISLMCFTRHPAVIDIKTWVRSCRMLNLELTLKCVYYSVNVKPYNKMIKIQLYGVMVCVLF